MSSNRPSIPIVIKAVLLMELFMFIAYNLMMTALQSFAQFLTGDAFSLGLSFGIFTLFAASFRLLAGRILGRLNDATVLMVGLSVLTVTVFGYHLSTIGTHLYVSRAVHGIGWALSGVAMMTLVARLSPPSRVGEVMGYMNGVNSLTMIIFPTIGTTIVLVPTPEAFQLLFTIAFIVSIVACLLAGLVWYLSKSVSALALKSSGGLIARPALRPTLSVYLLCLGFGAVLSYTPTLAYAHGVDNSGIYISIIAVGLFFGSTLGGPVSDRRGFSLLGTAGCVLASVGILIGGLGIDLLTFYLSAAMFGVGLGIASVTFTALAALSVPISEKPHAMATFSAGFDAGVMTGSIMLAVMVSIGVTLATAFAVTALIGLLSVFNYHDLRGMESTAHSMPPTSPDMTGIVP